MEKKYVICILCFSLLSGCASGEANQTTESLIPESAVIESLDDISDYDAGGTTGEEKKGSNRLTPEEVDAAFKDLYFYHLDCKDGSQIISLGLNDSHFYFRFMPFLLEDGTYDFFRKITPSYEASYFEDGSVVIPLYINDSGENQFVLRDQEIIFLNEDDAQFNQEYSLLSGIEMETYRLSRSPDSTMPENELIRFLRHSILNGNTAVFSELHSLIQEEDRDTGYRLELAAYHGSQPDWSADNPYLPEIIYEDSTDFFPQPEILDIAVKSLQTGRNFGSLGCDFIKTNYNWNEAWRVVKSRDGGRVLPDFDTDAIYKYDLNSDGLMEILFFYPGGTIGNGHWQIIFLDEDGFVNGSISEDWIGSLELWCYGQNYFILDRIIGFEESAFIGWKIYVLDHNGKVSSVRVYRENIGTEIVLSEALDSIEDSYDLDSMIDTFIDDYKYNEVMSIGVEADPDDQIRQLFLEQQIERGRYGKLDVNNDGVEDWINVEKNYPYGFLPFRSRYSFIDGKSKDFLNLQTYLSTPDYNLCHLVPYQIGEKNYFISLVRDSDNYIIKLLEIKGTEVTEAHAWLVTAKKRILISQ